jgi:hypothetical protein
MHDHNVMQMHSDYARAKLGRRRARMAAHPPRRAISHLVSVPASGSLGGGVAAIGHSGDITLLIVTVGPMAIFGLFCCLLGCLLMWLYRVEKKRYLDADRGNRRAIREYDATFADLVVSLLTRTRAKDDPQARRNHGPSRS